MGNCKSVDVKLTGSNSNPSNRRLTLAILGLDNAGKTVTAKGLQGALVTDVTPTIGFSSVQFTFDNQDITLYDLGGGANIRGIWRQYYAESYGFVFVIDASDTSRLDECRRVLLSFLENEQVHGKPVLLLANKQDVEGALDEEDICDQLDLEGMANRYKSPCRVEMCSAVTKQNKKFDPSIQVGVRWLLKMIEVHWDVLNERVCKDVATKKEAEKKEKEERAKRVQLSRELREQEERKNGRLPVDDGHDEPDGADPFRPIKQQLVESQKREAANKRKNNLNRRSERDDSIDTKPTSDYSDDKDRDEENYSQNHNSYRSGDSLSRGGFHQSNGSSYQPLTMPSKASLDDEDSRTVGDYRRLTPELSRLDRHPGHLPSLADRSQPNGHLEPVDLASSKKKKRKKFKLRSNRTAPYPEEHDDGGSPFVSATDLQASSNDTPRRLLAPAKTARNSQLERLAEDDDEDEDIIGHKHNSFTNKWNLLDDLPEMPSEVRQTSSHQVRGHRPNTDDDDDLIT